MRRLKEKSAAGSVQPKFKSVSLESSEARHTGVPPSVTREHDFFFFLIRIKASHHEERRRKRKEIGSGWNFDTRASGHSFKSDKCFFIRTPFRLFLYPFINIDEGEINFTR